MDVDYLKYNVNEALLEALTATAKSNSDDKIDYLGRYLIQIVERSQDKVRIEKETALLKVAADLEIQAEQEQQRIIDEIKREENEKKLKYDSFIESTLSSHTTQQELMDSLCNFTASYLSVPASYIASRTLTEDVDELSYIAANPSQTSTVIGNKLTKSINDYDESIPRQGVSFDAFIAPPEEEAVEEEDEENPTPKPPVKLPTITIENVMRNQRCKFFGIPKLGSLVVVPLSYESSDHEGGCLITTEIPVQPEEEEPAEEAAPVESKTEGKEEGEGEAAETDKPVVEKPAPEPVTTHTAVYQKREFILSVDTIGDYRLLNVSQLSCILVEAMIMLCKQHFLYVNKNTDYVILMHMSMLSRWMKPRHWSALPSSYPYTWLVWIRRSSIDMSAI